MSSDEGEDGFSSGDSPTSDKRQRKSSYQLSASSSSSESDEDHKETLHMGYGAVDSNTNTLAAGRFRSLSDKSCSSTNDEYQAGFEDVESGDESFKRPQFQNQLHNSDNDDVTTKPLQGNFSSVSQKLMKKMGYKPGKGLGKDEHGRTEPVEQSTQKGRRGLGVVPSKVGELPEDFQWSTDEEKPNAHETVEWISSESREQLSPDDLEKWLITGKEKLTLDDETNFIEPRILKGVLDAKTVFDTLFDEDLRNARFRSNPYETIGALMFLNRAAIKMANMDAICDFMFTKPKTPDGKSAVDRGDVLYFADVCAGPGGFSEYVLYRRGWRAKGFGFTLTGPCDFKLSNFYAGTPETFNAYYGVANDGNIFNPANLMSLKDHVLKNTEDKGVHFLMADGGFSVEGQENIQEILSRQLYLCQCLAALMLVRTGGHFVVKLFDLFTPFSAGLVYIMFHCFNQVSIHKPVTSRPANSERYLICKWKRHDTYSIENHLFSVNSFLWTERGKGCDVLELVPVSVMQEDRAFYDYIYSSNCVLGEKQIKNLLKIRDYSKDKNLKDQWQEEIKKQCLKIWALPDQPRKQPERLSPDDMLQRIIDTVKCPPESQNSHQYKKDLSRRQPKQLTEPSDLGNFKSVFDWYCMFLSGSKYKDLKLYIGCGGRQVYQLDEMKWTYMGDLQVTLPARTLIYGEIVKEYIGSRFNKVLHIVDALMLGGTDVSYLCLSERLNLCATFCKALQRPAPDPVTMRCKRLINMEDLPSAMNDDLECRQIKTIKQAVAVSVRRAENTVYILGSVLFLKEIKEPWQAQWSKKLKRKYFCEGKKPSVWEIRPEACMDMASSLNHHIFWPWEPASAVLNGHNRQGITRSQIEELIPNVDK